MIRRWRYTLPPLWFYVLAIVAAWIDIYVAYAILIFIPLYFLLPKQR